MSLVMRSPVILNRGGEGFTLQAFTLVWGYTSNTPFYIHTFWFPTPTYCFTRQCEKTEGCIKTICTLF